MTIQESTIQMNGEQLPKFNEPPLNEVALSVQFEELQKLVVPEIGLLWQHYGHRFKHFEQHPPLRPNIERFGIQKAIRPPEIKLVNEALLPRVWFLNKNKSELLQIQQDRFTRNWRKIQDSDQYPQYIEHVRPKFKEDLSDFIIFLKNNDIGKLNPTQCEVTYVNHIISGKGWEKHSDIGKIFTFVSEQFQPDEDLEDASFNLKQIILSESNEFLGRLYITVQPGYLVDGKAIFSLNIVARGKPITKDVKGVMEFMDLGRELIVKTFAKITRSKFHQIWKRTDIH